MSARVGCYLGPDPADQPRGAPPGLWSTHGTTASSRKLVGVNMGHLGLSRARVGGVQRPTQLLSSPRSCHFLGIGKRPEVGNQPGHFF